MKSLSTQFNDIVFLPHIQMISIEDADTYFKSVGYPDNYGSMYEAVLTATLDSGDVVALAEYEDYNTCEDIFQSIAGSVLPIPFLWQKACGLLPHA